MNGIFVHRISHFDTQEDNLGSLLGAKNTSRLFLASYFQTNEL
jgi:hypothetical protein